MVARARSECSPRGEDFTRGRAPPPTRRTACRIAAAWQLSPWSRGDKTRRGEPHGDSCATGGHKDPATSCQGFLRRIPLRLGEVTSRPADLIADTRAAAALARARRGIRVADFHNATLFFLFSRLGSFFSRLRFVALLLRRHFTLGRLDEGEMICLTIELSRCLTILGYNLVRWSSLFGLNWIWTWCIVACIVFYYLVCIAILIFDYLFNVIQYSFIYITMYNMYKST